jgi:hypothetical protein
MTGANRVRRIIPVVMPRKRIRAKLSPNQNLSAVMPAKAGIQ